MDVISAATLLRYRFAAPIRAAVPEGGIARNRNQPIFQ